MPVGNVIGGKYRLVRLLGAGGMGEVWAAVNEFTGGEVAIKLLRQQSDDLRKRLRREAQACAKLRHKNVIAVHDFDETAEGEPFLVMQLLFGETLAEHLGQTFRLPQQRAAQIARDVARALSATHKAGIIHRDLKPANIFLHREDGSEDAVVKVFDFGVSKSSEASEFTRQGVGVGSPAYMSPEQAGASRDLDHRSDLWSLGVVLFQMLAGKKPFEGDVVQLFVKILTEPIPIVSQIVRNVDPGLVDIVSRCLERDIARRVGSAEELAAMLDRFAQPGAAAPSTSGVAQPPGRPACPTLESLPVELQTISTWTCPEPGTTPQVIDADDEATMQYDPRASRAIFARIATQPPPRPSSAPGAWAPLKRPSSGLGAAVPDETDGENGRPPRWNETVRMSAVTAKSLSCSPSYPANIILPPAPMRPMPPPPAVLAECVDRVEEAPRQPATGPNAGVRRPLVAACAIAIGLAGVGTYLVRFHKKSAGTDLVLVATRSTSPLVVVPLPTTSGSSLPEAPSIVAEREVVPPPPGPKKEPKGKSVPPGPKAAPVDKKVPCPPWKPCSSQKH